MGQFSWLFSDTGTPIYSTEGHQKKVTMAYLEDGVQKTVYEEHYEGYGVFGGVDFYATIAMMNPNLVKTVGSTFDELRDMGINIAFGSFQYKSPQLFEHTPPDVVDFSIPVENHVNQGWYFEDEGSIVDHLEDDWKDDPEY